MEQNITSVWRNAGTAGCQTCAGADIPGVTGGLG